MLTPGSESGGFDQIVCVAHFRPSWSTTPLSIVQFSFKLFMKPHVLELSLKGSCSTSITVLSLDLNVLVVMSKTVFSGLLIWV